jgi:hypothetical protein
MKSIVTVLAMTLATALMAKSAHATPRPLPFTYTTDTLAPGELEVEQYADLTPVRGLTSGGTELSYVGTQFQTEFEYGLAERLELGLYVVYVPTPVGLMSAPEMTETTGIKERLRYVFATPGAWPIDVGLYGELVEGDTESEFEGKILLQRRFGNLRIDSNLWAEYELYYTGSRRDVVLNPTLGVTYQITPAVHVGAEGWLRVEFPNPAINPRPWALGPVGYLGPTVMFDFGKLWWSSGVYARVTEGDSTAPAPLTEPFGVVWARTVIGLSL